MNIIDYVSIIIIFASAAISFFRGFFQEIISIFMWFIGIYTYIKYYYIFSFFSVYINNKIIKCIVNFLFFFTLFLVIKSILSYLVAIFIKQFHLFFINQILGILFGIIRGVFIICAVLFFLEFSSKFINSMSFKSSLLIPYYNYFTRIFLKFFIKNIFM